MWSQCYPSLYYYRSPSKDLSCPCCTVGCVGPDFRFGTRVLGPPEERSSSRSETRPEEPLPPFVVLLCPTAVLRHGPRPVTCRDRPRNRRRSRRGGLFTPKKPHWSSRVLSIQSGGPDLRFRDGCSTCRPLVSALGSVEETWQGGTHPGSERWARDLFGTSSCVPVFGGRGVGRPGSPGLVPG